MEKTERFDLEEYITDGVKSTMKELIAAVVSNPAESRFMAGFALSAKMADAKRRRSAKNGRHIPPFLIASITSRCNLNCAGCYARANHACSDEEPVAQLTADQWDRIFSEASDLGISFILLAGGEPMVRPDVIKKAAEHKDILFPIFTNGTMLSPSYAELLKKHRNLVPVISIEGGQEKTDARRGEGVYSRVTKAMDLLKESSLIFGASVTVTRENVREVCSEEFLKSLHEAGCRAVIFVEYVPAQEGSEELVPTDDDRAFLDGRINQIRAQSSDLLLLSFPGDENTSEGCLAAGRGFFHINSRGGAEPCPFSPYSDMNVTETSLAKALDSELFRALQEGEILKAQHSGGCVLYENRSLVEALLSK